MERNANDNLNSQGFGAAGGSSSSGAGPESGYESGSASSGSTGGSGLGSGYGGSSGLGNSGSQGYGAGVASEGTASSTQSFGGSGSGSFGGTADSVGDKAKNALGSAKERATELKATLADKLEAGAEKLRSQSQSGNYAGATGQGGVATDSGALGQVSDKLASGMKASADFLRNADLDNMKSGIEKQVKENPGRSLLIAAGLGYLLGKAFRK